MALTDKLTNIANAIREKTGSTRTMNLEGMAAAVTNIKIPTALSDLNEDETHRTVTDAEKETWNNKSNFSGNYDDLKNKPTIPTIPEKLPNPNALTFTGAVEGSYDGSAPVSVEIPSEGGNKGWTLLYDGTITIEEAVKTVTVSLLAPCEGMVDFIGHISWTANANTESGMDDISISVGKANMDYGRIGHPSNAGNSVFQATVTSSRTYWGRANLQNSLMYNMANMQYGFSENAKNANYENVTIAFFTKTYAGTIILQLYGR